jgi:hypothetical protein
MAGVKPEVGTGVVRIVRKTREKYLEALQWLTA